MSEKSSNNRPQNNIAILIHGCHLETREWESIVWGDPTHGKLGRIPKGLQLFERLNAKLIIWGTGASKKDDLLESQYTFAFAVEHANTLQQYAGLGISQVESSLRDVSVLDTSTQNTTEEIANAILLCGERGITTLYLVSSPTHIARCFQEALKWRATGQVRNLEIFAAASDTCFDRSTPSDVVIVEPPHRGDLPLWQTYRYVRAIFSITKQGEEVFADFLIQFGVLLKKFGVDVVWPPKI